MEKIGCPVDAESDGGWRPCPGPRTFPTWDDLDEHMTECHPELAALVVRITERHARDGAPDALPTGGPTYDGIRGKSEPGGWMPSHVSPTMAVALHRTDQALRAADRGGDDRPVFVT